MEAAQPPPTGQQRPVFLEQKWKGFRPRYYCKEMDIHYRSKSKFPVWLGEYVFKLGASSVEE
jgi:hypothetical protein